MTDAVRPLAGLTVVEFGHSIAGPYAGHILGELGADVIKIEQPGGDYARGWGPPFAEGASTVFHAMNRGKQSVVADLGKEEDCARVIALILGRADIVIQNLKFEGLERLNVVAADLVARKPSLIWCNLGAYGAHGPLRHMPGYDPLMQAMSGLMSVSGEEGRPPVRVTVSIVDMATGMWGVIGIMAALQRRSATGIGGIVDGSLYETALAWMTVPIVAYLASGEMQTRTGSGNAQIVPYQAFAVADGHLMVAAGNDGLYARLCHELGCPELAHDPRFATNANRVINREVLIPKIEKLLAPLTIFEAAARLDAAGVPCGPIQTVDKVAAHPQTQALSMLQKATETLTLMAMPLSFDGQRPQHRGLAPEKGADTQAVLGHG